MEKIPTLQKIQGCINNGDWGNARTFLEDYKLHKDRNYFDDTFYILEASIYINDKNYDEAIKSITTGLKYNIKNYELYFMLGNIKEITGNLAQALFSYENSVFYCNNEDKNYLLDYSNEFRVSHPELPGKVAIVIVSYENLEYTKICVNSIRAYNLKASYEIIVIDNNSTDGTKEWLMEQQDIKTIINNENLGFPAACNQGIQIAENDSDIFLLNNDTVVMDNSIFCLRMGLYEETNIGAAGSVSNRVGNNQMISESFNSIDDYFIYCEKNNIYDSSRHDYRIKLVGFSMLFKRKMINLVGMLDENFGLGHYEDDDISVRLILAGYKLLLCYDSFIYHFGNRSFMKNKMRDFNKHQAGIEKNRNYFMAKWGIDLNYYSNIRYDIITMIDKKVLDNFNVLEIGCGCGATLLQIQSNYKNASVYGVELISDAIKIGGSILNIIQGNIENKNLSYPEMYFDYIIFGDILQHLHNPLDTIKYVSRFLKNEGYILAGVLNILNFSVIIPLLRGNFTYQDAGILDRSHLRFFTKKELLKLFIEADYSIESLYQKNNNIDEETLGYLKNLCSLDSEISMEELMVYQYLLKVKKK